VGLNRALIVLPHWLTLFFQRRTFSWGNARQPRGNRRGVAGITLAFGRKRAREYESLKATAGAGGVVENAAPRHAVSQRHQSASWWSDRRLVRQRTSSRFQGFRRLDQRTALERPVTGTELVYGLAPGLGDSPAPSANSPRISENSIVSSIRPADYNPPGQIRWKGDIW